MGKEWVQRCKDCDAIFGYSDRAYQSDRERGLSRIERCPIHRVQHAGEIQHIASSHFGLRPRSEPRSILGDLYLGEFDRGHRRLDEKEVSADERGLDLGVTSQDIEELYRALRDVQVVVLVGPTGSGKSTYVPFRLIKPLSPLSENHFTRHGPIVVTQPRIQATASIPNTVAEKLLGSSVGPGFEIGYRHGDIPGRDRGEQWDSRNRLIYVTDGTLLNWISDGQAGSFSIIMIDEAHERSCNIDLIMAVLKRELMIHPHLRLIIASATIDTDSFLDFYNKDTTARLVQLQGKKMYGYDIHWWHGPELAVASMSDAVAEAIIKLLRKEDQGGILAFLPGAGEILAAVDKVNNYLGRRRDIAVFPLYAALGVEEGRKARDRIPQVRIGGRLVTPRRVVIATNVAETSITIPDITHVIDSGLIKQTIWNPATCRQAFITRWHSQDGSKQRWGRAGRVQHGDVFTLYSDEKYESFDAHTPPEIVRECLDGVLLSAKATGVQDLENLAWVAKPPPDELTRSLGAIRSREILDRDDDLTEDGLEIHMIARNVSRFLDKYDFNSTNRGLDVAALLVLADRHACLVEAATVLAMMPRMGSALYWLKDGLLKWDRAWDHAGKDHVSRVHQGLRVGCLDDLDFAIKLFVLYEGSRAAQHAGAQGSKLAEWPERCFINLESFREVDDARRRILNTFTRGKHGADTLRPLDFEFVARLRLLLPVALPDRIIEVEAGIPPAFSGIGETKFRGIISSRCTGSFTSGTRLVAALLDRMSSTSAGIGEDLAVANFVAGIPSKIPSRDHAQLALRIACLRKRWKADSIDERFVDQIAPVGSSVELDRSGHRIHSIERKASRYTPQRDENTEREETGDDSRKFYADDSNRDDSRKRALLRNVYPPPPLDDFNPATRVIKAPLSGTITWHGPKANRGIVTSWSGSGDTLTVALQSMRPEVDLSKMATKTVVEATLERVIRDADTGLATGFCATLDRGATLLLRAGQLSLSGHDHGLERIEGQQVRLTIDDWGNERVASMLPALLDDLRAVLSQDEVDAEVITIDKQGAVQAGTWVHFAIPRPTDFIHSTTIPLTGIKNEWRADIKPGAAVLLQVKRQSPKGGGYRALIHGDPQISRDEIRELEAAGVTVEGDAVICQTPLPYDRFVQAMAAVPAISHALRKLLFTSNKMYARVVETESARVEFDAFLAVATAVKETAGDIDPHTTQQKVKRLQAELKDLHASNRYYKKITAELDAAWKRQEEVLMREARQILQESKSIAEGAESRDREATMSMVKALQQRLRSMSMPRTVREKIRVNLDRAWKLQKHKHLVQEIAKLEGWAANARSQAKADQYRRYAEERRRELRELGR